MKWQDNLLGWQYDQFDNIEYAVLTQDDIWLPDVIVANSVSQREQLG